MQLDEMGEFGLIHLIQNQKQTDNPVVLGIGDDCAVLPMNDEEYQLLSCDLLVDRIHFIRSAISPYALGYKSVAVNISDVAAMGGVPQYILLSIALPKDYSVEEWKNFYEGVTDICRKYHVDLIGGDTTGTERDMTINVTVVGKVEHRNLHLRKDAQPGDIIFVTGPLGGSRAGLEYVLQPELDGTVVEKETLLRFHTMPEPCVSEVRLLNEIAGNDLHALNDISDGLLSEATEIAEASGVKCILHKEAIPVEANCHALADRLEKDSFHWACTGGEDYQLIGSLSPARAEAIASEYEKRMKKELYFIGEILQGEGVFMQDENGTIEKITQVGYNHFAGKEQSSIENAK